MSSVKSIFPHPLRALALAASAAFCAASVAHAAVDKSLVFMNDSGGALNLTFKPILTSKTIRMYNTALESAANNKKYDGGQFVLYRYYCFLCSGESYAPLPEVAAQTIPALKNLGIKGYVSGNSFTLNAVVKGDEEAWNNYYWFKQLDSNGNVIGQSNYVVATDKVSSSETLGVKVGLEGKGSVPGLTELKGGGETNVQKQAVYTGADPTEQSVVAFIPLSLLGSTTTDATGLWDPAAQRFVVNSASQWDELIQDFTTDPAGWNFSFSQPDLVNSDFLPVGDGVRMASDNLLISSTAPIGSLVVYEVVNEFTYPGGSVSYFEQPTLGAEVVPEPAIWSLMILGLGAVGWAARRSRAARGPIGAI